MTRKQSDIEDMRVLVDAVSNMRDLAEEEIKKLRKELHDAIFEADQLRIDLQFEREDHMATKYELNELKKTLKS